MGFLQGIDSEGEILYTMYSKSTYCTNWMDQCHSESAAPAKSSSHRTNRTKHFVQVSAAPLLVAGDGRKLEKQR
jgi:hypothetical protein